MTDPVNLADRRRVVAARLKAKREAAAIAAQCNDPDEIARRIADSRRTHPSNGQPYDREDER
jgi:hypothetical protein